MKFSTLSLRIFALFLFSVKASQYNRNDKDTCSSDSSEIDSVSTNETQDCTCFISSLEKIMKGEICSSDSSETKVCTCFSPLVEEKMKDPRVVQFIEKLSQEATIDKMKYEIFMKNQFIEESSQGDTMADLINVIKMIKQFFDNLTQEATRDQMKKKRFMMNQKFSQGGTMADLINEIKMKNQFFDNLNQEATRDEMKKKRLMIARAFVKRLLTLIYKPTLPNEEVD